MKKSFKLLGVSLLSCSFLIGCNSVDSGAIEENATDFLTHTSIKSSSIVASDAFEVANTLSQAGKDDKGGFYLRYLTPFRVNSTSNVTLTYVRTYGSDVKNVPVSSVYDSVKNSDGKVLYYDGTDLVEKTAESKTDWYIAAYTIKFDSTAEGFNTDALNYMITAELNVTVGAETKKASKETSYNLNYDFAGQTICFKSVVVKDGGNWAKDGASTRVVLADENGNEISNKEVTSILANYISNSEESSGAKYWSFEIKDSTAKKVKFYRTNYNNNEDWGAETYFYDLSPLYNLYSLDANQSTIWRGNSGYKAECIVSYRNEIRPTLSINNELGGTAKFDRDFYYEKDLATITASANDGYAISSVIKNGENINFQTRFITQEINAGANSFEVTFKSCASKDFYFKTTKAHSQYGQEAYMYLWKEGSDADVSWPGRKMEHVSYLDEQNIWAIKDLDLSGYDKCIFVIKNGDTQIFQTKDLAFNHISDSNLYVESSLSWTTYVA